MVFGCKEKMGEFTKFCKRLSVHYTMQTLFHSLLSRNFITFRRNSEDLWVNWNSHYGPPTDKKFLVSMGWEERVTIRYIWKFVEYPKGAISFARHNANLKRLSSPFKKSTPTVMVESKQLQNTINAILKYCKIAHLSWKLL